jgi:pyridoxal phosphate enzyme (YggS family)
MSGLAERIQEIQSRIAQAASRAGRDPSEVTLVAVTKKMPPEVVDQALAGGLTLFGESKVQEAKAKIPMVSGRARWQMIGHLQSNKARDAVALFELIHSVDSVHLASELNKWAERSGKTQEILLEVNVAGEKSKFGLNPDALGGVLGEVNAMPRLHVRGLMTIAPFVEEVEQVRPYFRQLRALRDQLGLAELSMGMTHDFEVAIEEGATMVRVGTAIFGERTI